MENSQGGSDYEGKRQIWQRARPSRHFYCAGVALGWGDEDISAIMEVMEQLSGK